MQKPRELIESELKNAVVPKLRASSFKGSFPHFRRVVENRIDLLTFQFDQNGGGFVIEISHCPRAGVTTPWGEVIPPQRVTAWDLHPDKRYRVKPYSDGGVDAWFRYDDGRFDNCVKQVLESLSRAEDWWAHSV